MFWRDFSYKSVGIVEFIMKKKKTSGGNETCLGEILVTSLLHILFLGCHNQSHLLLAVCDLLDNFICASLALHSEQYGSLPL